MEYDRLNTCLANIEYDLRMALSFLLLKECHRESMHVNADTEYIDTLCQYQDMIQDPKYVFGGKKNDYTRKDQPSGSQREDSSAPKERTVSEMRREFIQKGGH